MDRHRGHGSEPDQPDQPGMLDENGGCAAFGPLLEAFYHHALTLEQAQSVAEHAAGCARCQAALADFAATDRLIAAARTAQPGPELRRRLMARIAEASMPFERNTVVNDVNDTSNTNQTRNVNDTPWTRPDISARRAGRGAQRLRVLLGTAAAVLVVVLLAGALLTRPHGGPAGTGQQTSTPLPTQAQANTPAPDQGNYANSSQFARAAGKCDPGKISASIPAHALLFDLAMVSPDEGWAVGAIESDNAGGDPVSALILHYKDCAWTAVAADFPGMTLMSVSMASATYGWAVGGSSDGKQLALHYAGGAWDAVMLPGENTFNGVYTSVRLNSDNDGWIVATHSKNSYGITTDSLLHLADGRWNPLDSPITSISDVLPVGPNEAWMAGIQINNQQRAAVLYHYQNGSWTSATLPSGVEVNRLRMVAPNDIWASGHINAPSNVDYEQSSAVLHYDGNSWRMVSTGARGRPQFIQAFDANTGWAFTIDADMGADTINGAQYQRNGTWLRVKWLSANNVSMGLVPFGMSAMQRVSADEYWAIGILNTTGGQQATLLYFANGAWHAYGQ